MKYFELKGYNAKAFRAALLLGILVVLVIFSFFFVGLIARYGEMGVAVILVGILPLIFLKRAFRINYRVGVSDEEIIFYKNGMPMHAKLQLSEIAMIRHRINMSDDYLHIFRRGERYPYINISTIGQSGQVREILVEIGKRVAFIKASGKRGWDEYINKEATQHTQAGIKQIRKQYKDPGKKNGPIIALVAVGICALMIVPLAFIKSEKGYSIGIDEITYNDVVLDINRSEYKWLGSSIVKDSSRVYFLGEVVEWADAPTFEEIGHTFFRDKNGLYREQLNFFTKNKLVPLTGDFDGETLVSVDRTFYKDKNRVYYFDYNLGAGKNPLKPVKIDGIDAATFEVPSGSQTWNWYQDKNHVYFGGWADFRRCPEIDRATFKVLTWQVAKDQNNVYYQTRHLTAEGGNSRTTDRDNYAILKGAHAPSFRMIDRNTFEDKNTTWTIDGPGRTH